MAKNIVLIFSDSDNGVREIIKLSDMTDREYELITSTDGKFYGNSKDIDSGLTLVNDLGETNYKGNIKKEDVTKANNLEDFVFVRVHYVY